MSPPPRVEPGPEVVHPDAGSPDGASFLMLRSGPDGLPMGAKRVPRLEIPHRYRVLLTQDRGMTESLSDGEFDDLRVHVFSRRTDGSSYSRDVRLERVGRDRASIVASLEIELAALPERCRAQVLAEELPFGAVLRRHDVGFRSRPVEVFEMACNELIRVALELSQPRLLYGRRALVTLHDGSVVGSVIEVLHPEFYAPR